MLNKKNKKGDCKVEQEKFGFEWVMKRESHAQLIMAWRNNPETLKVSFHQEPKQWPFFWKEFQSEYFSCVELPPVFVLFEGKRVAFLRFRPMTHPQGKIRNCCDISINLAPEWRGKGLATGILKLCNNWVRDKGFDDICADIKEANFRSEKVFSSAGYSFLDKAVKVVEETGEKVPVNRYLMNLTSKDLCRNEPVFIIAEAGSNWRMGSPERDLSMAFSLVDVAAKAGADAIKFQTYRPETVYVKNAGSAQYLSDVGMVKDISDIFSDLAMPYEMIPKIAEYCKKKKIQFMSSPFSTEDFEMVDPYVSMHKIASYEISHIRLLECAAKSGKPLILSTGATQEFDIQWAVNTFRDNGGTDLTLLQCTAKYPADEKSMNLKVIPWLKHRFGVKSGLSDHSKNPIYAPLAAVALGGKVIEKHFTLDRRLPGPDHFFSITPLELKQMVEAIRSAEKIIGESVKQVNDSEKELRSYARRGIQAISTIKKDEELREGVNIEILRPGRQSIGVHPRHLIEIEGKFATREISEGSGIQQGDY